MHRAASEARHVSQQLPAAPSLAALSGRSLDVIRLLEPQIVARRPSFDSIVWTAVSTPAKNPHLPRQHTHRPAAQSNVLKESQHVACSLRAVHTAYHNLGLHAEGQAVGNATAQWLWRVYGPAVGAQYGQCSRRHAHFSLVLTLQEVRDLASSVRLRDAASSHALSVATAALQVDVWPQQAQFAVHVIAHLLQDYIGHSTRCVPLSRAGHLRCMHRPNHLAGPGQGRGTGWTSFPGNCQLHPPVLPPSCASQGIVP